jgi:hypothetical protein
MCPCSTQGNLVKITTKLLKIWLYKTTVVDTLQLRDPVMSVTGIFSQFMMVNLTELKYFSGETYF